jgi:hypothetical protein
MGCLMLFAPSNIHAWTKRSLLRVWPYPGACASVWNWKLRGLYFNLVFEVGCEYKQNFTSVKVLRFALSLKALQMIYGNFVRPFLHSSTLPSHLYTLPTASKISCLLHLHIRCISHPQTGIYRVLFRRVRDVCYSLLLAPEWYVPMFAFPMYAP